MIRHIVADGQTSAEVAQRYGIPLAELAQLNGLAADQPLHPGVMLWLPESRTSRTEARSARAEPLLCVPEALFTALTTLKGPDGAVVFRIVRAGPGEPLALKLP